MTSAVTERIAFLSCFFPVLNEEGNIGPLLDEALQTLPRFCKSFEIIAVDDGSTDRTAAIVAEYAERDARVRVESHGRNLGYGLALRTGLRASRGDAVLLVDGDRQFRLEDLSRLLPAFAGADLVAGYRIKRSDGRWRLVVAAVYKRVLGTVFGLRVRDPDCGFKLIRRGVLDAIADKLESRSAFISPELLIRAQRHGFKVVEVGVPHHPRVSGKPKGAPPRVIARTIGEIVRMRRELGPPAT